MSTARAPPTAPFTTNSNILRHTARRTVSDLWWRVTPQCCYSWHFGSGKTAGSRKDCSLRLPSPESTLRLPLALFLPHSATEPLSHSSTLFLFPLLTFTPEPVAVYRHSISVAPLDKRNFSSHLRAECYFRGSWQTQKSQSPSCQWQAPPLLTNCPSLSPPLLPLSHAHTNTGISVFVRTLLLKTRPKLSSNNNYNRRLQHATERRFSHVFFVVSAC